MFLFEVFLPAKDKEILLFPSFDMSFTCWFLLAYYYLV